MKKKITPKLQPSLTNLQKLVIFIVVIFLILSTYILYDTFFNSKLVLANSLPVYPDSTNWNLESKGAFPDDAHYVLVVFSTSDSPQKIIDFYQNYFVNNNWNVQTAYTPGENEYSESLPYSRTYVKNDKSVGVLIKPSIGNVINPLGISEKQDLNTVSFYVN